MRRGRILIVVLVLVGLVAFVGLRRREPVDMQRITMRSGGETRSLVWYRPASVADDLLNHPVVIALHGLGMEGLSMAYFGEWTRAASAGQFSVVFPDGLDRSWNAGLCCGSSMHRSRRDARFIRDVIDWVGDRRGVDRDQVILVGYSNGGMLALRLACDPPGGVAAVVVDAAVPATPCVPKLGPRLLLINDPADPTVPPKGGYGNLEREDVAGPFPSLADTIEQTARRSGCGEPKSRPTPIPSGPELRERRCAAGGELDVATWRGLGHTWDPTVTSFTTWWLGVGPES